MIILRFVLVMIMTVGMPVVLGTVITDRLEDRYRGHILSSWVFGMIIMFGELQLMAVPMIICKLEFHSLFYTYVSLVVAECIYILSGKFKAIMSYVTAIPYKLKKNGLLGLLVILSILIQGFMLGYFEHVDDDDARFVPSAVAAVEKDMMFEENPVTGQMMYSRISEVFKDMVSPWIMFWAIISKAAVIHPAILMHSIVPVIFIPFAYAVYWLIAGVLFDDNNEKKLIFTGIVSAINIFSGYSVYNSGAFFLLRIWQGKALFTSIMIPFLFFVALRMFKKEDGLKLLDYVIIFITCCGASLTSGFGIILTAMFFGLISVIYGIKARSIKQLAGIWISMLPCVAYGFLYAFGGKLFI